MKKINRRDFNNETMSYNSSIADLMAGMLIIFILLFVFVTISSNKEIKKKEEVIASFTKTKSRIIDKVIYAFKENKIAIDIDNTTGSIKIDEKLLFANNDYKLKKAGKEYLRKFISISIPLIILLFFQEFLLLLI